MTSLRLYYDDSYTTQFSARVIERLTVKDKPALVLDRTFFYPTGGGQPHDSGTINGAAVLDVFTRDDDKAVVHVVAETEAIPAVEVACTVDWAVRFDLMQHHTGQHILSAAFIVEADAHTVGFHLSGETVTIDLDKNNLTPDAISRSEALANRIVWENHPVTARLVDPNDLEGVRMRKLPEHLATAGLRVVDIDGFDVTACGGTHVRATGEIGLIKIVKTEKRGDKTRVEFKCGGRAFADYAHKHDVLNRVALLFNAGVAETDQIVGRLQEDYKAALRDLKAAQGQLIEFEAARLHAAVPEADGRRVVTAAFDGRDAGELRLLANALAAFPGTVALLGASGDKTNLIFGRSADSPGDMNALLKSVLTLLEGGRGGGQPHMAQGGGGKSDVAAVMALLEAARGKL
jgi:alanyl-tRNA synthetase